MNHWLEEARRLDPVHLFCCSIQKLNRLFQKRRDEYGSLMETALPRNVAETFKRSVDEGSGLHVLVHTRNIFEVQRLNDPLKRRVVDISAPSCSCCYYKEFGIPCRHLCAAVLSNNENPNALIVKERRLASLKEMYSGFVVPVDLNDLEEDDMRAPTKTKKRGRPKGNEWFRQLKREGREP